MKTKNLYAIALSIWSITLLSMVIEKLVWIQSKLGSPVDSLQLAFWQLTTESDCQLAMGVVTVFSVLTLKRGTFERLSRLHFSALNFHTVVCLSALLAIPYLCNYGGKGVSFLLSKAGHYDLAERAFAVVRDQKDIATHNTVAAYLWNYSEECNSDRPMLRAVARQYGTASTEVVRLNLERAIQIRRQI